jgi:hypothetical protein
MNFTEAIEPHEARLDAYQQTKSFGGADTNELRELINIFMEYVANPKGDMIPSLGCGNCVNKMFQRLVTHREIERQKNVDLINNFIELNTSNLQIDLEDQIKQEEAEDLSKMAWGELKKYAKSKGVEVFGRRKADIIIDLNKLYGEPEED